MASKRRARDRKRVEPVAEQRDTIAPERFEPWRRSVLRLRAAGVPPEKWRPYERCPQSDDPPERVPEGETVVAGAVSNRLQRLQEEMATLSPRGTRLRIIPQSVADHVRNEILRRMQGAATQGRVNLATQLAVQLLRWAAQEPRTLPVPTAHRIERVINEEPTRLPAKLRPIARLRRVRALVLRTLDQATELTERLLKRAAERVSGNAVPLEHIERVADGELKRLPAVLRIEKRPGRSQPTLPSDIWEQLPVSQQTQPTPFDPGGESTGEAGLRYLVPTELGFDREEVVRLVAEAPAQTTPPLCATEQPFQGGMRALVRAEVGAAHLRALGVDPESWPAIYVRNAIDRGEPKQARRDEQTDWCCAIFAGEQINTRHVKYPRNDPPTGVKRFSLGRGVMIEGVSRPDYEQGVEEIELFMLESEVLGRLRAHGAIFPASTPSTEVAPSLVTLSEGAPAGQLPSLSASGTGSLRAPISRAKAIECVLAEISQGKTGRTREAISARLRQLCGKSARHRTTFFRWTNTVLLRTESKQPTR